MHVIIPLPNGTIWNWGFVVDTGSGDGLLPRANMNEMDEYLISTKPKHTQWNVNHMVFFYFWCFTRFWCQIFILKFDNIIRLVYHIHLHSVCNVNYYLMATSSFWSLCSLCLLLQCNSISKGNIIVCITAKEILCSVSWIASYENTFRENLNMYLHFLSVLNINLA